MVRQHSGQVLVKACEIVNPQGTYEKNGSRQRGVEGGRESADPRSECQKSFWGRGLPLPHPSPLGGPIQQVAKCTRNLV